MKAVKGNGGKYKDGDIVLVALMFLMAEGLQGCGKIKKGREESSNERKIWKLKGKLRENNGCCGLDSGELQLNM